MKKKNILKNLVCYLAAVVLVQMSCKSDHLNDNGEDRTVTGVSLSYDVITLAPGDSHSLIATVEPFSAEQSVIWTSSDPNVAEVDYTGKVTAHTSGTKYYSHNNQRRNDCHLYSNCRRFRKIGNRSINRAANH